MEGMRRSRGARRCREVEGAIRGLPQLVSPSRSSRRFCERRNAANTPQDDSSVPSTTRLTSSGSVRRKPAKPHSDPPLLAPQANPNSSHLSPSDPKLPPKDVRMNSPDSHSSGERDRGWTPPWKAKKSFDQQ